MNNRFSLDDDGVVISTGGGWLKLQAVSDDIIRVAYSNDRRFFSRPSLGVVPQHNLRPSVQSTSDELTLSTAKLKAKVNFASGNVTFMDAQGKVLLAEKARNLAAASVQGQDTFHVQQQWQPVADESLYGLGENQLGLTDIKGYDLDLWQHNGTIVVPLLVSNRGYGVLWDNPSFTRFGDLRPFSPISRESLVDASGKPGAFTATYFSDPEFQHSLLARRESHVFIERHRPTDPPSTQPDMPLRHLAPNQGSARWEGSIIPPVTGDYQFQTFSDGQIQIWIDGRLIINDWRQSWLPWKDLARVHLEANRPASVKIEWSRQHGSTMELFWKPPAGGSDGSTSLWSEVGGGVDYYFINGPRIDNVIAGYRQLTGAAPMMPAWIFGLWQSRQRYEDAQASLDVVEGFRSRKIPFDNIVQDWRYWPEGEWGSHKFDPERFPDPVAWINEIHQKHARLMISVWGKFYPGTDNFKDLQSHGFLYPDNLKDHVKDWLGFNYTFFDAFNPEARQMFWRQMKTALFDKGVDAWWLDATEPDVLPQPTLEGQRKYMNPTFLGPGSRVLNAYPLVESEAVYNGQRAASPDQRVFILTRSGYSGQQRYAAASWSGDTSSTWTALQKQIPAGIGFCISGVPYWTMDVGGFSVPERFSTPDPTPENREEWYELNTRWFEFGAFCPMLRVHGEFPYREMWEFGGDSSSAYQAQLKFDRLRYRLLPYIYSLAGAVTLHSGTMMRGLAMDFPGDSTARRISDQFMFGPALLVNPVTEYRARSRQVYLPQGTGWYDFWSGTGVDGGQTIAADAPYDSIPLYVRAGSIIPFGPDIQYTNEKKADPIALYVYQGADGDFTLYEDDGLTYSCEKGAYSLIPIHWNDDAKTLTIGKRQGSFNGMLTQRTFNVIFASRQKRVGFSFSPQPEKSMRYTGDAIDVR
ncbi:MAG TPA: TIM-barrel domain-containing protein [Tepidisphaeraceae bacterium]|jgi:alpha-D-xyloside xylohydrolase|nr:TIM-barrel domain-containing protein [Tepidisphaeraceae bacterium]